MDGKPYLACVEVTDGVSFMAMGGGNCGSCGGKEMIGCRCRMKVRKSAPSFNQIINLPGQKFRMSVKISKNGGDNN